MVACLCQCLGAIALYTGMGSAKPWLHGVARLRCPWSWRFSWHSSRSFLHLQNWGINHPWLVPGLWFTNPQVTVAALEAFGVAPQLFRVLKIAWLHQNRFICYGDHVHPQKLHSRGMPQGCPLSPLMMAIWVSPGVRSVRNQTNDNSRYVCYMDDRSFWCPDVTTMETQIKAWHEWSQVMGTCAVGRGKTKVSLKENHPEWAAEEIKILGVCTMYKPLANIKQENDRPTAAKNRQRCYRRQIKSWLDPGPILCQI